MKKLCVLWATDGSSPAASAVPFLRELAIGAEAHLIALCVAPHAMISGARPDPAFVTRVTVTAKDQDLQQSFERARHALVCSGLETADTEIISRWGNPIEQILQAGRRSKADLIVLGAKGHSNLQLLLLGSVSQGVVQNADRPVLIARPGGRGFRRVLVGYDGSAPAARTLQFLKRMALPTPDQLVVSNVVEPFTLPTGTPLPYRRMAIREAHTINQSRRRKAEHLVQGAVQRFPGLAVETRYEVLDGVAAVQLERAALIHDADVVAVGSRKPSRVRHYLLGSTAEKLVRHAPMSVLVVR